MNFSSLTQVNYNDPLPVLGKKIHKLKEVEPTVDAKTWVNTGSGSNVEVCVETGKMRTAFKENSSQIVGKDNIPQLKPVSAGKTPELKKVNNIWSPFDQFNDLLETWHKMEQEKRHKEKEQKFISTFWNEQTKPSLQEIFKKKSLEINKSISKPLTWAEIHTQKPISSAEIYKNSITSGKIDIRGIPSPSNSGSSFLWYDEIDQEKKPSEPTNTPWGIMTLSPGLISKAEDSSKNLVVNF